MMSSALRIPFQALGRKVSPFMGFANMIKELTDSAQQHSLGELFDELLNRPVICFDRAGGRREKSGGKRQGIKIHDDEI